MSSLVRQKRAGRRPLRSSRAPTYWGKSCQGTVMTSVWGGGVECQDK